MVAVKQKEIDVLKRYFEKDNVTIRKQTANVRRERESKPSPRAIRSQKSVAAETAARSDLFLTLEFSSPFVGSKGLTFAGSTQPYEPVLPAAKK